MAAYWRPISRASAASGIVDELMRQQQRARLQVPANGAYRCHRDNLARPSVLECPQVGAVVDLMRRDAVALAVARQEYHVAIGDAAERERAGRLAVRRARSLAASDLEVAEPGEAAAADDGQHRFNLPSWRGSPAGCASILSRPCRSRTRSGPQFAGRRSPA